MTDAIAVTVIPAKAGIQPFKNALYSDPLDSRLRGNDGVMGYACYYAHLYAERCPHTIISK